MELKELFRKARNGSRRLGFVQTETINTILLDLADEAVRQTTFLLSENAKDLAKMDPRDPRYDRLKLTEKRINNIAVDIRNVATLDSPLSKVIMEKELPNHLLISKIRVPIGVIGVIYEARPNVTFDVFSLCLKTGNVSILKGGSDAAFSNQAIISVIQNVLQRHNIDPSVATLLPADRAATSALLNAVGDVDVIIPRGSQQLIDFVRENAKVPVIETGAGIVHTYFDVSGDLNKGKSIIHNAKTRRVSVCNALDCLIIHEQRLADLFALVEPLIPSNVIICADPKSFLMLQGTYPDHLLSEAHERDFGTEFLDYKMSIKTVASLDEALDHISTYSSHHSEAIIAEDKETIEKFLREVDAAAVYANASTAFTDGAQFGLGAEIGISTQKLHARGPMGLEELTTYKWIIRGNGQIRKE